MSFKWDELKTPTKELAIGITVVMIIAFILIWSYADTNKVIRGTIIAILGCLVLIWLFILRNNISTLKDRSISNI